MIRERFTIASRGLEHGPENMRFARAACSRDKICAKQFVMPWKTACAKMATTVPSQRISELNSAAAFFRLKNAITLFSSEMCWGVSKSTSHPQTMMCVGGSSNFRSKAGKRLSQILSGEKEAVLKLNRRLVEFLFGVKTAGGLRGCGRDRGAGGRESCHESSNKQHCRRGDHIFPCVVCIYSPLWSAGACPRLIHEPWSSTSVRPGQRQASTCTACILRKLLLLF